MIDISKKKLERGAPLRHNQTAYPVIWDCTDCVAVGCSPRNTKWGKHPCVVIGALWYYLPVMAFKSDEEMQELAQSLADMANLQKGLK